MKKRIYYITGVIFTGIILWMFWANKALEVNNYVISSDRIPESFDDFRIAHLSDMHNEEFGKQNEKLIHILEKCEPDLIAITGDLVDSSRTDMGVALSLVREAVKIAPVCFTTGNHEYFIEDYDELEQKILNVGTKVLRNSAVLVEREGACIRIAGFDDPCFGGTDYSSRLDQMSEESDIYTVWLSHRPELFDVYADYQLDLVLTGHAHGGQFRFPFIGGLVAPGQGLFPEYDAGLYTEDRTNMIVSRGIGNSLIPMRFNNRPEVIIISLRKD